MRRRRCSSDELYFKRNEETISSNAQHRCEYCLIHEQFSFHPHEIDHVYAQKHGGTNDIANLCYSCYFCNRYKGSDLASLHPVTREIVRLYHPRNDQWAEHFKSEGATITSLTDIGIVTIRLLRLNEPERVIERSTAIRYGLYP